MLTFTQIITGVTVTALTLSLSVGAAYDPSHTEPVDPDPNGIQIQEPEPIEGGDMNVVVDQVISRYLAFTGTVKEIYELEDGSTRVLLENEDGALCSFNVYESTFMVTEKELKEGAKVTGFYDAYLPAIMIYPPQYTAMVMAVDAAEGGSVSMYEFDENMVSIDNYMKLTLGDDTVVVDLEGNPYEADELSGKVLIVEYGAMTRSIPGQTTPSKITVYSEFGQDEPYIAICPPIYEFTEEEMAQLGLIREVEEAEIIVEQVRLDAPKAFVDENGSVMVPLRAIAEALGYSVEWDGETQTIQVGDDVELTIGAVISTRGDAEASALNSVATIVDDNTFVPLSFFNNVLGCSNAYLMEGQIVIDNGETME